MTTHYVSKPVMTKLTDKEKIAEQFMLNAEILRDYADNDRYYPGCFNSWYLSISLRNEEKINTYQTPSGWALNPLRKLANRYEIAALRILN